MRIEELIKSENMEQFLVDYLILKRKSNDLTENGKKAKITSKNLYYAFRKQFRQIDGNADGVVNPFLHGALHLDLVYPIDILGGCLVVR